MVPLLVGLEPKKTRVEAQFHQTYPLQAGAKLNLENVNGSVEITAWDKNILDITATRYAESRELLDQLKIDISVSSGGALIRTLPPTQPGDAGVKYVIKAPRRVELSEIRSTNGSVRIDGFEAGANLRTTNGSVHATKTRGRLQIATSNGSVQLQDVEGDTEVRTSNGAVQALAIRGPVAATTSNGSVKVDLEDSRGGPVTLETSNGAVDLKLGAVSRSDVLASTSNGSITVRIPASSGANVKAQTTRNSRISSDFDIRKEGDTSPSRLQGVVGSGGPKLDLTTSQGSIRILKL
ncbi:MAG TPA: DUF4097 family beta strand repeat-containing protein [Bryobacteraceae bacterium]|nr:DUF4097 family beta strand repeat-containing protein [Bryobacteraceae bacterium]